MTTDINRQTILGMIPNPHPVLFVGVEDVGQYDQRLCVAESVGTHDEDSIFFERSSISQADYQAWEQGFQAKGIGFANEVADPDRLVEALTSWKAVKRGITSYFHDVRHPEASMTAQQIRAGSEEFTSLEKESRIVFDRRASGISRHFQKNKTEVSSLLFYASMGEKTFAHATDGMEMSTQYQTSLTTVGEEIRELFRYRSEKDRENFLMDERDADMAKGIARVHLENPRMKATALVGQWHIRDGKNRALPQILKEDYKIESTTIAFINVLRLEEVRAGLAGIGVDPTKIVLDEALAYHRAAFGLNAAETYLLVKGISLSEGIHPLQGTELEGVDYAVVLPDTDDSIEQKNILYGVAKYHLT